MKKSTILIVDDDKSNIDILSNVLNAYTIIPCLRGDKALDIVQKNDIDLILLDIVMPIMDGFEVAKRLKEDVNFSKIPIIFLSSENNVETIEKAFILGGVDYITKPFNIIELLVRIKNHLELRSYQVDLELRVNKALLKEKKQKLLMQQQARHAQMGKMIAMIAHQWRQPLSAIASNILSIEVNEWRVKKYLDREEYREEYLKFNRGKLSKIIEHVSFLSQTIDDFRNFFKPDKNKISCFIDNIIDKALNIIKSSLESRGIELVLEFYATKEIFIYENQLIQVILNILKNSEDNFILNKMDNPQIIIRTKDRLDGISLNIDDNGGGILEDILPYIFDPYFSTKESKNGTGIGLYMSKIMIEEHHNGTITAINKDSGVSFEILLKA